MPQRSLCNMNSGTYTLPKSDLHTDDSREFGIRSRITLFFCSTLHDIFRVSKPTKCNIKFHVKMLKRINTGQQCESMTANKGITYVYDKLTISLSNRSALITAEITSISNECSIVMFG